jgi:hypothetical protein
MQGAETALACSAQVATPPAPLPSGPSPSLSLPPHQPLPHGCRRTSHLEERDAGCNRFGRGPGVPVQAGGQGRVRQGTAGAAAKKGMSRPNGRAVGRGANGKRQRGRCAHRRHAGGAGMGGARGRGGVRAGARGAACSSVRCARRGTPYPPPPAGGSRSGGGDREQCTGAGAIQVVAVRQHEIAPKHGSR